MTNFETQMRLFFDSKAFVSLVSLIIGIFLHRIYLYIKGLQNKYDYSDELREIVNNYIFSGNLKAKEFAQLFHKICQMADYMGIYHQNVFMRKNEIATKVGLDFMNENMDVNDAEPKIIQANENNKTEIKQQPFYESPYDLLQNNNKENKNKFILEEKKKKNE